MANNIVATRFSEISPKAWKQKVQYLLAGKEYEQELVRKTNDGVSVLPYYTLKDVSEKLVVNHKAQTQASAHIEVSDEIEANQKAIKAIDEGITTLFFSIHNSLVNLEVLLEGINCCVFLQCLFLDVSFPKKATSFPKVKLLIDPLGKLSRTGDWYTNENLDFINLKSQLKYEQVNISINLATFQNAGASEAQQLAYTFCQLKKYLNTLKSIEKITYLVSTGTDFLVEIAKLKALKVLHETYCDTKNCNINYEIIQLKSSFTIRAFPSDLNLHIAAVEQLIGKSAEIDFCNSIPQNYLFFDEDQHFVKQSSCLAYKTFSTKSNNTNGALGIEKIAHQLVEKSLQIAKEISKGGGYLAQLEKGTIQYKIKENCEKMNILFAKTMNTVVEYKTPKAYPFTKPQKYFTKVNPLLPKKWSELLEKPIWDNLYKDDK